MLIVSHARQVRESKHRAVSSENPYFIDHCISCTLYANKTQTNCAVLRTLLQIISWEFYGSMHVS